MTRKFFLAFFLIAHPQAASDESLVSGLKRGGYT
jgi:hypothetical protein